MICQYHIIKADTLIKTADMSKLDENYVILYYGFLIAYLDFMNRYLKFKKAK